MNYYLGKLFALFFLTLLFACKNDTLPKPKAVLRLEYPNQQYTTFKTDCGFSFNKNAISALKCKIKENDCACEINYSKLNATIFLTYRKINNDLRKLLTDAQNLTQEHVVKADDILPSEYINNKKRVFGMSYKVIGNAASPSQFYITDSTQNFLLGSLYFKTKPNYDSILPAAEYLRHDMRILMESITWN